MTVILRPYDEWHEEHGQVLWYRVPIREPPFVSCPLSSDFLWEARSVSLALPPVEHIFPMTEEEYRFEQRVVLLPDGSRKPWATHWCPLPDVELKP